MASRGGVAAQRVDQQGPLTNEGLAHFQNHALSLPRDRFHRHEMHAWPPRRLADRLGVVTVIFAAFDVGFDVLRWDQSDPVTECDQLASPMVRAGTGLHGDLGRRELAEEA